MGRRALKSGRECVKDYYIVEIECDQRRSEAFGIDGKEWRIDP